MENSVDNALPFLDNQISLKDDHFESIVYRKQTYTGFPYELEERTYFGIN